jgi:hypothetical protein
MPTNIAQKSKVEEARAKASLEAALDRLQEVLTEENTNLGSQVAHDHSSFIIRKNHILRELMILQRMEGNKAAVVALNPRLREIRALVDRNHQLLKSQVDAMNSITTLLTNVAMTENADGTYTRHTRGG